MTVKIMRKWLRKEFEATQGNAGIEADFFYLAYPDMLNISDPKLLVNSKVQSHLRFRMVTPEFEVQCKLVNSE